MEEFEDPAFFARAMQAQLETGQIEVLPTLAHDVRTAARRDPLGSSGVLLAALEMRAEGQSLETIDLLEIARVRDPRDRITRALLLEAYLQAGNVGDGAAEIVALDQLSPNAESVLLPILWSLIEQPSSQAAAVAAIPQSSRLRRQLAQSVAREQLAPEVIFALQDRPSAQNMSEADRQWIASLILPYIQSSNIDAAILLSRYFYPSGDANPGLLTDPEFSGFPGPPFGWELDSRQGGFVDMRENQLRVSHYGRSAWTPARQVLRLAPGSYQLSYEIAEGRLDRPNLTWRVDCLDSGARLLDLPLSPEQAFGMTPTDRFTVPEKDCTAQWLVLAARIDDEPSTRSVAFRAVEIAPAGEL